MKSAIVRTAIVTSLVTVLAASALAYFAMPRMASVQAGYDQGVTLQGQPMNAQAAATTAPAVYYPRPLRARVAPSYRTQNAAYYPQENRPVLRDGYGEPIRHQRSTAKSAMIVAGSAGAGAAIGGLAGGGKGAAIGAISGGAAGFIFDRLTHNK